MTPYIEKQKIRPFIKSIFKNLECFEKAMRSVNKRFHLCRILVLDKGQISEFDAPNKLLENKLSIFYGLAKEAGIV